MDISKLPRLSQTPSADPSTAPSDVAPVANAGVTPAAVDPVAFAPVRSAPPPTSAAEAWISIAIGVLVLLIWPTCMRFIFTGAGPGATDVNGNNLTYTQSAFFLPDLGLMIFGIALVLEGILLFIGHRRGIWAALVLTVIAALVNLVAVIAAYHPIGLQVVSLLAVAVCVYMCLVQWRLLHPLPLR